MNRSLFFLMLGTALSSQAAAAPPAAHAHPAPAVAPAPAPAPKLQAALRTLWQGHVLHTREYALAVHANQPAAAKRAVHAVVANATRIADAVAGFYGKAAGERMLALLAGHWGAVQALTDARHAGDEAGQQAAFARLTANAGEIAGFLAGANPHLPEDAVRGLLTAHGAHHVAQVQQIMVGDTRGEAATWTAMQRHMDTIADALAAALALQFPDKAA